MLLIYFHPNAGGFQAANDVEKIQPLDENKVSITTIAPGGKKKPGKQLSIQPGWRGVGGEGADAFAKHDT